MSNDKVRRFCVVDHAGKTVDRRRSNPNRKARDEETERWLSALQKLLADDELRTLPPKRR